MSRYIAIFASARKVVLADELCRESNLESVVIHVPKEYSSECGMCLRIDSDLLEEFETLMRVQAFKYELHQL